MSEKQRALALDSLELLGFRPAYGGVKTMRRIMDKSKEGERPQFYFVFRDGGLIGYMFLIGDEGRYRAFPYIEVNNLDELPMRLTEPLMRLEIDTYKSAGDLAWAAHCEKLLEDYRAGIAHRRESDCR